MISNLQLLLHTRFKEKSKRNHTQSSHRARVLCASLSFTPVSQALQEVVLLSTAAYAPLGYFFPHLYHPSDSTFLKQNVKQMSIKINSKLNGLNKNTMQMKHY